MSRMNGWFLILMALMVPGCSYTAAETQKTG